MGVDHDHIYALLPDQLVDGPEIVSSLKQVIGKAMAEGVQADWLIEFHQFCCGFSTRDKPPGQR